MNAPDAPASSRGAEDRAPAVTVVVPTLDEAENVDPLLGALLREARAAGLDAEVAVVDGGSRDGTPARVRAWEAEHPVRLVEGPQPCDLSTAVLRGVDAARAAVVVVMDADGSHPPETFPALAQAVLSGRCDLAIGSRYVPGGRTVGWPIRRQISSQLARLPGRLLTGTSDPLAGFFAARRADVLALGGGARGFKILLEVLARGRGRLRVEEMPIVFRERERGASKLGPGVVRAYLAQCLRLWRTRAAR